jgi:hypothetical protein
MLHTGPVHVPQLPGPRHAPLHVVVHPGEQRIFRPGQLRPGDFVMCGSLKIRISSHPNGSSWSDGDGTMTPAGKSRSLGLSSRPDGSVIATCGS